MEFIQEIESYKIHFNIKNDVLEKITICDTLTDTVASWFEISKLTIPSKFDGEVIRHIGSYVFGINPEKFNGHIKEIIISDNIQKINSNAFFISGTSTLTVNHLHWPHACSIIPDGCFFNFDVLNIDGIEDVNSIGTAAFKQTGLRSFNWPVNCTTIPESCFEFSPLDSIQNIENITKIESYAFSGTNLTQFDWPSKCKIIPKDCFTNTCLSKINGIENVVNIGEAAFESTLLTTFTWPKHCRVIPPYCFYGCNNLNTIQNLNEIENIDTQAFWDCTNLKRLEFIPTSDFKSLFKISNTDLELDFTNVVMDTDCLYDIVTKLKNNSSIFIKLPYYIE